MVVNDSEIIEILNEVNQAPKKRQGLLREWSSLNQDRNVISYFSSFNKIQAMINDTDRDIIESILVKLSPRKPLDLIINSPGGLPLSAERIINVCRKYSTGFRVVVPKLAKSAATMIALGADEILLGETSELGPIDPQMTYFDYNGRQVSRSAFSILTGVNELLDKIVKLGTANSRIEGYLALMPRIDQAFLVDCQIAQKLSKDIVINFLKQTTFPTLPETKEEANKLHQQSISQLTAGQPQPNKPISIEEKIDIFLNPEKTFAHGRGIMYEEAENVGLKVNLVKKSERKWRLLLKIYYRSDWLPRNSANIIKVIESPDYSYSLTAQI